MKLVTALFFALSIVAEAKAQDLYQPVRVDNTTLWVNSIVGKNGVSTVECWGIQPPFVVSSQARTVGNKILQLGQLSNASYSVFPDGHPTDAGLHNAPNAQWVVLLSGSGNINFPDSPSTPNLTVKAPELLIAVDTPGTSRIGHRSVWEAGTSVIQMPLAPGFVPGHKTINGACPPVAPNH
ncbi:hypothetical protein E1B28_002313 [Marasmius oreades]|uniref:Uncharacterized protein n=1 Tax=Marasmius oreades TaxID=181124 RepID=A0A9P7RMU1_9AGAR|nr:uncharacterized protein E1B28_002313 [Marasmius oreades]KAG7086352.1 hypothetical protein E1B28_002313 [Marasmius oreades]